VQYQGLYPPKEKADFQPLGIPAQRVCFDHSYWRAKIRRQYQYQRLRLEFITTSVLLVAIATAANSGFRRPVAARGIATAL
jgi:hypothetical protein